MPYIPSGRPRGRPRKNKVGGNIAQKIKNVVAETRAIDKLAKELKPISMLTKTEFGKKIAKRPIAGKLIKAGLARGYGKKPRGRPRKKVGSGVAGEIIDIITKTPQALRAISETGKMIQPAKRLGKTQFGQRILSKRPQGLLAKAIKAGYGKKPRGRPKKIIGYQG